MKHAHVLKVLILIILEVLYEILKDFFKVTKIYVLILIILEVLYEIMGTKVNDAARKGLNPYYTGSTL